MNEFSAFTMFLAILIQCLFGTAGATLLPERVQRRLAFGGPRVVAALLIGTGGPCAAFIAGTALIGPLAGGLPSAYVAGMCVLVGLFAVPATVREQIPIGFGIGTAFALGLLSWLAGGA